MAGSLPSITGGTLKGGDIRGDHQFNVSIKDVGKPSGGFRVTNKMLILGVVALIVGGVVFGFGGIAKKPRKYPINKPKNGK